MPPMVSGNGNEADVQLLRCLQLVPLPIFVLDANRYTIVMANEPALSLCGRSSETLHGMAIDYLFSPDHLMGLKERLRKGGSYTEISDPVFFLVDSEGRHTPVEVHVRSLDHDRVMMVMHNLVGVIDWREKTLQEQRLGDLGRMASGIAHDFNNLLIVIRGFATLILERMPSEDNKAEDVRSILKAADEAFALTGQMLQFSRSRGPRQERVDLNTMIRHSEKLLRRLMGEDIGLELQLSDSLWTLKGDSHQLMQVLMSLCTNARDAMKDRGTVVITTRYWDRVEHAREIKGQFLPLADYCILEVSDTGCGIPPDVLPRIFQPFFTTKGEGAGTGLGLSNCQKIIVSHGGCIKVTTSPNMGTTFHVYLPRLVEEELPVERERDEKGKRLVEISGKTVLIVEDQPEVALFARKILEARKVRTLKAGHGQEALDVLAAQAGKVDIVFMDIVMPGMGGLECAEIIKERYPGQVILLTSGYLEDKGRFKKVVQSGFKYLPKPYTEERLVEALQISLSVGTKGV